MRLIVFDFETANVRSHSACALGMLSLKWNPEKRELVKLHEEVFLIQPPNSIFEFTHVHGITFEDVKNSPRFHEHWTRIRPYFEEAEVFVAHNIQFDARVLSQTLAEYGIEYPKRKLVCTVKLARKVLGFEKANLRAVSTALGIELNHHEAMSDARACAKILETVIEQLGHSSEWLSVGEMKLNERKRTAAPDLSTTAILEQIKEKTVVKNSDKAQLMFEELIAKAKAMKE